MTDELAVHLGDPRIGRLVQTRGRTAFEYDEAWRSRDDALPLSLSMPLAARQHPPRAVEPYLWGLLPDNDRILERWGRRFHVSARSAFALLAQVGADCPGAVRIIRADRGGEADEETGIEWLSEADVASRLRTLRADVSAWRAESDAGQFSLAGAQPKTALWFDGSRWGVPRGRTPTTHILKPGILDLEGSAENEHFCLEVARGHGLPTVSSSILQFEDQIAIVVERYDRVTGPAGVARLHQEDICQALAVHPEHKYENDGGPGARAVVELLREVSTGVEEDIDTFVGALVFNWLIAGPDAHAKNYSLLIAAGGRVRLAPLYDLASALPYPDMAPQKLKLAMKIGGKYRLRDIGRRQWQKLAADIGVDPERVVAAARSQAAALPDVATSVLADTRRAGLVHPVVEALSDALVERARSCAALVAE